jgi:hypothetical protein
MTSHLLHCLHRNKLLTRVQSVVVENFVPKLCKNRKMNTVKFFKFFLEFDTLILYLRLFLCLNGICISLARENIRAAKTRAIINNTV